MTRIQIGGTIVEHRQRPPIRADVGCGDLAAVTAIDRVAFQVFGVGLWDTGQRADHPCRLYVAITWSQWQAQQLGRSEARLVGEEGVKTGCSRRTREYEK